MKRVPLDICTGCAACLVSCVHNAIEMVADHEGFLYPQIDDSKCTQCGNCTQVCPVESDSIVPNDATNSTVYAGWAKDREVLLQSTSGGIFSEIAFKILDAGGVVFGAAYDDAMTVKHIAVEDREGLAALRGSKYVQSDVNDTYRQVSK
ncbi:MAG: coenzyme F420 hydrogenase/dehydrogenase beta subunit N-terminal domain-containing protein [Desulfobacterales bacterium]